MNNNKFSVILVAGGSGQRMGNDIPKQFLKLNGKEVIVHTIDAFMQCGLADNMVIVCNTDYMDFCRELADRYYPDLCINIVPGGHTRQESVYNGIKSLKNPDYVLIHDAVRCCISPDDIIKICRNVSIYGSCALGVKVKDTVKVADGEGYIASTPDREHLWQIQTPQAFSYGVIMQAHERAKEKCFFATDDCALAEAYGEKVKIIEGSYENIKITTPFDLIVADLFLKKRFK